MIISILQLKKLRLERFGLAQDHTVLMLESFQRHLPRHTFAAVKWREHALFTLASWGCGAVPDTPKFNACLVNESLEKWPSAWVSVGLCGEGWFGYSWAGNGCFQLIVTALAGLELWETLLIPTTRTPEGPVVISIMKCLSHSTEKTEGNVS